MHNRRPFRLVDGLIAGVDGLALAGLVALATAVSPNPFATIATRNAIWLAGGYVLFCLGVLWLKRLEPEGDTAVATTVAAIPPWLLRQNSLRLLGVLFALLITTLLAQQLGYFQAIVEVDVREIGSGESSALLVFGPGAWLGGALFYMLILGSTAPPTLAAGSNRARWRAVVGLLFVNGMLLLTVMALAPLVDGWLWGLPILLLLLALFAPPRLVYWSKRPFRPLSAATSALLLIAATIATVAR